MENSTQRYERRLNRAHFAHLHAVAEGLAPEDAAQRFLAADSRAAARRLHEQTVQLLRAIVQRRGDPRWRLVMLIGRIKQIRPAEPVLATATAAAGPSLPINNPPLKAAPSSFVPQTLEQWIQATGIDPGDWGERELLEFYEQDCREAAREAEEAHAADRDRGQATDKAVRGTEGLPAASTAAQKDQDQAERRRSRALRLVARQRELLREIEPLAVVAAHRSDRLGLWLDDVTAHRMERSGLLLLGELLDRISNQDRGGLWYRHLPAIGATKASRIEAYVATLIPPSTRRSPSLQERIGQLLSADEAGANSVQVGITSAAQLRLLLPSTLDGSCGINRATPSTAGTRATNDLAAIQAWIQARVGTPGEDGFTSQTARAYRLEAERLLLWCLIERRKPLSSLDSEDCAAYKAFLADVPEEWISRRRAARHQPGWAPFAGKLTRTSQQHALTIVCAMFRWLVEARYLASNPWIHVKTRLGDDPRHSELDSRALTPAAWGAIMSYIETQPPSAARSRAAFVLDFSLGVGLRSAELIAATLGDFVQVDGHWALPVHGKGKRNRTVAVPGQAVRALETYLRARGLPQLALAVQETPYAPLVASVNDTTASVGYRSLYDSLKVWMGNGIRASRDLTSAEKDTALRASLHWLRHTCGTRSLERGVTVPELQGQLGHADPRTTMRYGKTQLQERQSAFERAFS
ncbi:hypothetical protein JY96_21195 [Aquabacterium sp. NJ1]|uniref:tyrosine-type recombinase/integrase n=1 Tax=Aquabacterium sp. NJ1 TaxID=1538295 RepID=UPI00052BC749|nr:tyrosine-type recombinase/integrase [Aquabacterium sp. NJ1]KGM38694.1 hypothetical protein JY96_21195 [Aquabacterium sp. NJ1]